MSMISSAAFAADAFSVEVLASNAHASAAIPISQRKLEEIRALSERLFPGPISLRIGCDPEYPRDVWIVFDVQAQGTYANFRDREFEWYESVARTIDGDNFDLRLCIVPKP